MMNEQLKFIQCFECKEALMEDNFYKYKDGSPYHLCKNCMCKDIDDFNPLTFIEYCQIFNIPYIESEWRDLVNLNLRAACQSKKLYREKGYGTVFGQYLTKMKLKSFFNYKFEDSAKLNMRFINTNTSNDSYWVHLKESKNDYPLYLYIKCIKPPKNWKEAADQSSE